MKFVKINSIKRIHKKTTVYNLACSPHDSYFANNILVHNCKPGEDLIFGKFRMRSIEHFMGEIEQLHERYRFNSLVIDDDLFTAKPDYVMEWCDRYARIGKPFALQTRSDIVCRFPDVFKRLKEVGCHWVRMGLESGNQRVLGFMRKGTTVEQNYESVKLLHGLGLNVAVNYMLGNPTESKEEMLDTIRMMEQIKPENRSASFYTPIVGTDMYDYCKTQGLLISEDPAVLGTRSINSQPRIKGVDYNWIQTKLYGRCFNQRHALRRLLNRRGMGWARTFVRKVRR